MTHAPPSTDDPDGHRLLDRLCDADAAVVYFPVRHHSPMAAGLAADLIASMRPAAVLIEGPSDYNPHFAELHLDHEPPVALYSYFRNEAGASRGAFYPFCDYSPEWAAIQAARKIGAAARFIDLPWSEVADVDRTAHRYADADLGEGRVVEDLCRALGVEDFHDLWDEVVEAHPSLSLDDYLKRTHALCCGIRFGKRVDVGDRRREAFMAEQIRAATAEFAGRLLVVTGGYHSPALAARLEGLACNGIQPEPEPEQSDGDAEAVRESGVALMAYSYARLDALQGYEVGMPNPGFYDHVWRARRRGDAFSHRPLILDLVRELRERKQTLSTADMIALETSARSLAALRGRDLVWRRDLVDAVESALVKDETALGTVSPLIEAVHAVLRGRRRGRIAQGARRPPLVTDINHQLAEANLTPTPAARDVDLNLLEASDLAKSRLLHRLRLLDIVGFQRTAGTDFLTRSDLTKLWERWRVEWSPNFEAGCIEASRYGATLAEAAGTRLLEAAGEHQKSAPRAAELLVRAALAGMETATEPLLAKVVELVRGEASFVDAAAALGHLLFLYCHDEALGAAGSARLTAVVAETFSRTLWLLEALGQTQGNRREQLDGVATLLETFERAERRLDLSRDEFVAVLERVEAGATKPPDLRGAAAGALWTLGRASAERILSELMLFSDPERLGDFLAGLFAVAREAAQRHPELLQAIDRLLLDYGPDEFRHALPSLRLAFSYFTPREKHHALSTLFAALGVAGARPLDDAVDAETAAEALALEERLFAVVERYQLAGVPT